MGNGGSRGGVGLLLSPQIYYDQNEIPIHHKCRNCGEICSPERCATGCVHAVFTRTGKNGVPPIVRPVVPTDRVRWDIPFAYVPIDFTSERILTLSLIHI